MFARCYVLKRDGYVDIERVNPGDEIFCEDGYREAEQLVKVKANIATFSVGSNELICNADTMIKTDNRNCVEIRKLQQSDDVIVLSVPETAIDIVKVGSEHKIFGPSDEIFELYYLKMKDDARYFVNDVLVC